MAPLADRYELAEPLGTGGMARVVAAYDRVLQRRVAVKLIRDELLDDDASRQRLLREARSAAALHHPNTVAVFDVGQDEHPFIVMELIEGESLADRLAREGRLDARHAVEIAAAVLEGLAAAHDRGLVHRDVKPSNILLPSAGGVKLADFGIAKELAGPTSLTATGSVLGTPRYLAPEQAAGQGATPASDLYALGAVLYECLAGRAPFEADSPLAVALAHQQRPVPSLTDVAPEVPPVLAVAVERALAKRPEDRPADARAMRAALESAAADGTARAGTTATLPVGEGAMTRRWGLAAAVLVPLALLVLGVALLTGGTEDDLVASSDRADAERGSVDGGAADEELPSAEPAETDETDVTDAPVGDAGGPEPERDLDDLIAALARDPDAAGEKGDDLLDDLRELRGEGEDEERVETARELVVEIGGWLAADELEEAVGAEVLGLLAHEARPAASELEAPTALLVDVAGDMSGWGKRADKLLDGLEDLLDEDDAEDRAKDAAKLIREIERWVERDDLDADRGGRAIEVLRPVAS
jgi:eukaryotic-like serine/threonine-protein kinase